MDLISKLTNIANAIRSKMFTSELMSIDEMASNIAGMNVVIDGVDNTTTFNSDGTIGTSYSDGRSEVTTFESDGSVVTEFYKNGELYKTEKNVFNSDDSVSLYVNGSFKYKQIITSNKDSISTTYEV